MMGMGEPLLNFDNAVRAASILTDDFAFGISKRRVTLSTAGVVPGIYKLAEVTDVSLAVSLHAPNDELRDKLVPINRKYPIAELMAACHHYLKVLGEHRSITIEYTLMRGVNDSLAQAHELAKLLRDLRCKINLIPFNPFPASGYERPDDTTVRAFQTMLLNAGYCRDVAHDARRRHRGCVRPTGRRSGRPDATSGALSRARQSVGGRMTTRFAWFAVLLMLIGGCVTERDRRTESRNDTTEAAGVSRTGARLPRKARLQQCTTPAGAGAAKWIRRSAEAHVLMASVYIADGDTQLAEREYKEALRNEPRNAMAQNNYGTFLFSEERYKDAAQHLKIAANDPSYAASRAGV